MLGTLGAYVRGHKKKTWAGIFSNGKIFQRERGMIFPSSGKGEKKKGIPAPPLAAYGPLSNPHCHIKKEARASVNSGRRHMEGLMKETVKSSWNNLLASHSQLGVASIVGNETISSACAWNDNSVQ